MFYQIIHQIIGYEEVKQNITVRHCSILWRITVFDNVLDMTLEDEADHEIEDEYNYLYYKY